MTANLIRAGIVVILALALGYAVTQIDGHERAAMYSERGERYAAVKVFRFPLVLETSSLAYDEREDLFYTTPDKGKPHIVEFRLGKKAITIVRTDTIIGIKKNYDFEGIEVVEPPYGSRYLQLATERYRRRDSLVMVAVSIPDKKVLDEKSFAVWTEGIGDNNNFEAVTYDPYQDYLILGKEYGPYGLFIRRPGQPAEGIFSEREFKPAYAHYLDSAIGPYVAPDRLAALQGVTFSGMAFDKETRHVLVLNRQGRAVIELELNPNGQVAWRLVRVLPFQGIDDADIEGLQPAMLAFGIAEGLAVWGAGKDKRLAIITDPGTGGRPTLYIFPFPR